MIDTVLTQSTHSLNQTPWPFTLRNEQDQQIRHQISRLEAFRTHANQWLGRLEGILAKHWPEILCQLRLSSATLLSICSEYGSPAHLAADPNARQQLRSWGRGQLSFSKIDGIIESARQSFGIPLGEHEQAWLREYTSSAALLNALGLNLKELSSEPLTVWIAASISIFSSIFIESKHFAVEQE